LGNCGSSVDAKIESFDWIELDQLKRWYLDLSALLDSKVIWNCFVGERECVFWNFSFFIFHFSQEKKKRRQTDLSLKYRYLFVLQNFSPLFWQLLHSTFCSTSSSSYLPTIIHTAQEWTCQTWTITQKIKTVFEVA
jgi:hypothetical protein